MSRHAKHHLNSTLTSKEPGELVGIDCFYVGRLKGTEGAIWQLTAIDVYSSYAWAELVICKRNNPTAAQTNKLAKQVATELRAAGWKLQRMLSDSKTVPRRRVRGHPRAPRDPSTAASMQAGPDQRAR